MLKKYHLIAIVLLQAVAAPFVDKFEILYRVTGKECNLEHLSMFLVK